CSAEAVIGPQSRTFYVSPQGVYLWIGDAWGYESERKGPRAYVYRLPFGRERPSAVAARGFPVDQFSFREDGAEGEVAERSILYAAPVRGGPVARLGIGHFIDRIELLGSDALAVGGTPKG